MSYLPLVALLSVLSFPCVAETLDDALARLMQKNETASSSSETLAEQFSRMDRNKDGFLSEQEFIQGMNQAASPTASVSRMAEETPSMSLAERERLVDEAVSAAKKLLPFKVDQATTWTDVYGKGDELHYVYRVEMDVSAMPVDQIDMLRPVFEQEICPKVKPGMCGVANDTLLKSGVSLITHYNDRSGKTMAECRFTKTDCP